MHPDNQNLLVIRTIEDADAPALRKFSRGVPEEIVVQIFGTGMFEADHLTALRIDAGHDVLNHAVLACRVHCLEDQQQRPGIRSIKQALPFAELLDMIRQGGLVLFLRMVERFHKRRPLAEIGRLARSRAKILRIDLLHCRYSKNMAFCGKLALAVLLSHFLLSGEAGPQPPCGAETVPPYPALDAAATSKLWSRAEFGRDWKPPACTGWASTGFTTLVTTVARFRYAGGAEDLLRHAGEISLLSGTRYWSTTHQKWEVLIPDAYALTGNDNGRRRGNFTSDEMKPGSLLYFNQTDNLTGKGVFRMHIAEVSADRIVFDIENVTTLRYLFVPIFHPGDVQSVYFLDREQGREQDNVWRYYSILRTGLNSSSLVTANESSAINRAVAVYHRFVGITTDQEPPAAR